MPKKKPIRTKAATVNDLLALIPDDELESFAAEYQSDKWVPKLRSTSMFKLVFYSLLRSERFSLRQMAENYGNPTYQMLDRHAVSETAHNSIRDRLLTMNANFFRRIYEHLYTQIQTHYSEPQLKHYHIKRYDSTMMHVFTHLLDGMKVGRPSANKRQVKLTTEFVDDLLIQMHFSNQQSHLSEEVALREVIENAAHSPKDILVFDRGLKKRDTLVDFDKHGWQFVTRLNDNTRFDIQSSQQLTVKSDGELEFIRDCQVYLYASGDKRVDHLFRLIETKRKTDGKHLLFLTNMATLSTEEVAYIYSRRWDIEVLFKFMKQEMNLTHFISHDANAIAIILYCTMIASMLILLYRKLNGIRGYRMAKIRFFNDLQVAVLLDIMDFPENIETIKRSATNYLGKL